MRPVTVTVGPLASPAANNICTSQTPLGAGALTLNGALVTGGVAVLDTARRVLITTTGDETSRTFTIVGTNWSGNKATEVITGVNNTTVYSVLDYKTVTSITISGAAANALTVGTNGIASSPWVFLDAWAAAQVALQCTVSGTVNYTVQQTLDDPASPTNAVAASSVAWVSHPDTNLVGATGTVQGNYAYLPIYTRVLLNSETGAGFVTMTVNQAGSVSY